MKLTLVAGVIFSILTVGCTTSSSMKDDQVQVDINEVLGSFTRQPQVHLRAGDLRAVKIPKDAPWLARPVHTTYRQVSVTTAIESILDRNPVRYEITHEQDRMIKVSAPAGAITIQDHLNAIATQANWAYSIENHVVGFTDWLTKTYPLAIEPGTRDATLSITPISQSGTAGDVDRNNNTLTLEIDPYEEFKDFLEALIGEGEEGEGQGASSPGDAVLKKPRFAINQASASVTLSASPNLHRDIGHAIDDYNHSVGQSILLDIAVYNIDRSHGQQRSIDLDLLRSAGLSVVAGTSNATLLAVNNAPNFFRLTFTEDNRYDGSSIIARALALTGHTSVVSKGRIIAKNNQVSNLQESDLIGFFDYSFDNGNVAGRLPRFTESIIQVLPTVHGNRINMRLIVVNTEVEPYIESVSIATQTGGSTDTTTPEIKTNQVRLGRQYVFPVELIDGETVLIAGLQTDTRRHRKANNKLLPWVGDTVDESQSHSETVVVITAHLL